MSASLEASLKLDIAQYQAQLAKARGEAKKFRDQLQSGGSKGGLGGLLGNAGDEIKSLLPAAGIAAIVGGTRAILNEMDDLADASQRLGESTEVLQRVEYASKLLAGVDLGGVTNSFLKLEKALGDLENAAASKALERYGVSAESLTRLPLDEKMIVLAEAFQKARADGTGYNDLLALLGKSAGDLIPLLEQSGESLRATFAEAPVLVDGAVQNMAALNDRLDGFLLRMRAGAGAAVGLGAGIADMVQRLAAGERNAFEKAFSSPDVDPSKGQQDKRDERAKALAEAKAKAVAEAAATEAIKSQAKAKAELQSLQDKDTALAEKRMADYLSILPPNLKLIELKREMIRLEQERDGLTGPGLDQTRLEIETDLLSLRKQSRDAERDLADEKERAAEQQKADSEKAGQQGDALASFQAEMDLINAKIAGNKQLVNELEKQAAIQQIQQDLMEQAGLSEQDALTKAKAMVDAKKALEDQTTKKDGTIKGYSRERQGGADEARQRAEDRVNESRGKRDQAMKDSFGSFKDEDQRLKTKFRDEFAGVGGKPKDPAANPLGSQAQANANKENAGSQIAANPQQQTGQQLIALITQIYEAVK